MRLKWPQHFRKKPTRDPWKFAVAATQVMSTRVSRALTGHLSAAEARRMIAEKQIAAMQAQCAYMHCLLDGDPHAGGAAAFDVFDRAVQSNRKRLMRRRRRWPFR